MTHDFDDALRRLPEYELPEEVRRRHLDAFANMPNPRRKRGRRRVVTITACVVVGLSGVGVGTAAALGVFSAPPADRSVAHCYATIDLNDPGNHTDDVIALPPDTPTSTADVASAAMDICTGDWQQGRFSTADPKVRLPQPPPWNHPVPPLIACVLDNGQVGVFPGTTGTCASLGLPVAII